jgi:hypothetical protein
MMLVTPGGTLCAAAMDGAMAMTKLNSAALIRNDRPSMKQRPAGL